MKKKISILIAGLLVLSFALAACQPAAPEAPAGEPAVEEVVSEKPAEEQVKEVIKMGDQQWQSLWINNAIAAFIMEHGYGYPVEIVELSTPIFQQAIVDGEIDANMESWFMNYPDWWAEKTGDGTLIDAGDVFESSAQGWYVPRYVIEGDEERGIEAMAPDLKSVYDLAQYAELFSDPEEPEKGMLVSCITGWQCAEFNRIKFHAYGLEESYNLLEPGSQGALDAAIAGPYMKGDPVLSYYWEPTWLLGTYDMVRLEEPEYSDECWENMQSLRVEGEELDVSKVTPDMGCAYENVGIPSVYNSQFAERAPEVAEFLDNMFIGTANLNKVAAYMTNEDVEADEAALWYFENYADQWNEWVPADVAEKVQAAVDAAK